MMRLWILRPVDASAKGGPWDPWYDCTFSMVVRAATDVDARRVASDQTEGDEGGAAWLDATLSACEELPLDGPEGLIIADTAEA